MKNCASSLVIGRQYIFMSVGAILFYRLSLQHQPIASKGPHEQRLLRISFYSLNEPRGRKVGRTSRGDKLHPIISFLSLLPLHISDSIFSSSAMAISICKTIFSVAVKGERAQK